MSGINAETLIAAGKKAENERQERVAKVVKGVHLQQEFLDRAKSCGLETVEKSGFLQITGRRKGLKMYVALKGGRVDFSGFSVDTEAVKQITEAEARDRHLGRVRGQMNFEASDDAVRAAFETGIDELLVEAPPETPAAPKPVRTPKQKKEKTTDDVTTQPADTEAAGTAEPAVTEQ